MKPYPHQTKIFTEAYPILKQNGLVCLSMEERTGKTLVSLMLAEATKVKSILILTKKKALPGWEEHLTNYPVKKNYELINYHSIHKIKNKKPDLVILDEAHYSLSGFPKPGTIMKSVRTVAYNKPCIFLSATFSAQSFSQLFHIFAVTKYSPWNKYKSFYKWAVDYVDKYQINMNGRLLNKYDRTKDGTYEEVEHLFISYTRSELGFAHEPKDVLHYIPLGPRVMKAYTALKEHGIYGDVIADTPMGLMGLLHQLEGGIIKTKNGSWQLSSEKIDYIIEHFGDSEDTVIMAHYILEQEYLANSFKHAKVLSATAYAEGVDLSSYKNLIIYSQSFSTSQHKQRRARQANMKRNEEINVHFLLVKKGVSEAVYKTVSKNGKNFVDRYYLTEQQRQNIRKNYASK